jgi:uncharacterized protein (DUF433 family)
MDIYPGISIDPLVRLGKPCLTGTRLDVATVVGALGSGESYEEVQEALGITHEQVLIALRFAAHTATQLPPAVQKTR